MATPEQCTGEHRFYVADVAIVEAEGKVVVILVCTACGKCLHHDIKVADSKTTVTLLKGEKQ